MLNKEIEQKPAFVEATAGKENVCNIPNFLTFSRIIGTFLVAFFIFADFHIFYIIAIFIIAMFTDVLDGFAARKLKSESKFGAKFDMVADRFFMIGFFLLIVMKLSSTGLLDKIHFFQFFFIIFRDVATSTIGLILMSIKEQAFPKVRFIGKITTFMQTVSFPLILLSVFYLVFGSPFYFAVVTGVLGLVSSCYYIFDVRNMMIEKKNNVPLP